MTSDFYRTFEDKHRGTRDLITSRLRIYLPFVEPLLAYYPKGNAIDLGCGRGEWLELALAAGFDAIGIDLDVGMLAQCHARQLPVRQADALEVLRTLPADSHALISAFHVAEHLSFVQLELLVNESLRVLQPGGLLILESPNSENLMVGTSSFYLDPTHNRPVHPQLLSFLMEYTGFARSQVLRLNEDPGLLSKRAIRLYDVLAGASPDFAVIAQKSAPTEILATFDREFNAQHGLPLHRLANHYDELLDRRLERLDSRAQIQLKALSAEIDGLRGHVVYLESLLNQSHGTTRTQRVLTHVRSLAGRILRRSMPMLRTAVVRIPWAKHAALAVLRSSPRLANFIGRFLPPGQAPVPSTLSAPQHFEDLRSVRIMRAVSALPSSAQSVTFLEIGDHAK